MVKVKISVELRRKAWEELRAFATGSNQSISTLLTRAIEEFLQRRRIRPEAMRHLEDSIRDNEELGRRLAK